jgi:hypothetical protein
MRDGGGRWKENRQTKKEKRREKRKREGERKERERKGGREKYEHYYTHSILCVEKYEKENEKTITNEKLDLSFHLFSFSSSASFSFLLVLLLPLFLLLLLLPILLLFFFFLCLCYLCTRKTRGYPTTYSYRQTEFFPSYYEIQTYLFGFGLPDAGGVKVSPHIVDASIDVD